MTLLYCDFILLFIIGLVSAAPQPGAEAEHIIIIDQQHPSTPDVEQVLQRVSLHCEHPNVKAVYNNSAFTGFAASISSKHAQHLNDMSDVLLVEQSISIQHTSIGRRELTNHVRKNATWGLERISNAFFQGTESDTMDYDYSYGENGLGKGVDIWMVDSGIWVDHHGFEGRAKMMWSFDGNLTDTDGHGTHTAGTAGAIDFGVASDANILGVRVLDDKGEGSSATVIAGIDYVIQQHDIRKQQPGFVGAVISISLAAAGSVSSLDQAVSAATTAGIHVCVAAGNQGQDACSASPASSGGEHGPAITVGSIGIDGQTSSFSNYGSCVDVYAPGENILSASMEDPDLLVFMSGTSQATPHVTGVVAYAMTNSTLAQDPVLMKQYIQSLSLPLAGGQRLVNNGAVDQTNEGMLGLTKQIVTIDNSNFHRD